MDQRDHLNSKLYLKIPFKNFNVYNNVIIAEVYQSVQMRGFPWYFVYQFSSATPSFWSIIHHKAGGPHAKQSFWLSQHCRHYHHFIVFWRHFESPLNQHQNLDRIKKRPIIFSFSSSSPPIIFFARPKREWHTWESTTGWPSPFGLRCYKPFDGNMVRFLSYLQCTLDERKDHIYEKFNTES